MAYDDKVIIVLLYLRLSLQEDIKKQSLVLDLSLFPIIFTFSLAKKLKKAKRYIIIEN